MTTRSATFDRARVGPFDGFTSLGAALLITLLGVTGLPGLGPCAGQEPSARAPESPAAPPATTSTSQVNLANPNARVAEAIAEYRSALETEDRDARLAGFRRATRSFRELARAGIANPDLYTNLGNAALQSEDLATAILAYRAALQLDPDHVRAQQNLDHTRSLLPTWVPKPSATSLLDTFFFWHRGLSRSERSLWAALCFALAGCLLAGAIRWRSPGLRNLACLPAVVWVALVTSLALETRGAEDAAVITVDEVVARAADSARAQSRFAQPLPGGTEVVIQETRGPWLRVQLADGRDGWVTAQSATRIGTWE
ncbi:MAG: tetratricopeptide repeat protein [Planctomycetota bacterium]